ncbi:MAG: hypothetical protein FJW96_11915, partial [Actinobacteria bacterium]|nr:hypothetical protein [Actinomycetota bacterium]
MTDVVDCHCHLFPSAWQPRGHMPPDMFDVEGLLEKHAGAGISAAIVSDPHIWYGDLDPSEIARTREYNDFAAELGRTHGDRLAPLGTVTPWRGDEHLREAERAVTELGLRGLALPT